MELFHALIEAHRFGATLYVGGFLSDDAAARTAELMVGIPSETKIVRVDLRAVELIDPRAFVLVARTLNRWRDARGGRVMIEFPKRSTMQRTRTLQLVVRGSERRSDPRDDRAYTSSEGSVAGGCLVGSCRSGVSGADRLVREPQSLSESTNLPVAVSNHLVFPQYRLRQRGKSAGDV
jgi:ABC-type transporter Mla MlaB component